MARVLIIGAGGVGQVVTHKCAQVPGVSRELDFPQGIGRHKIYLMYHEELESLLKHFPEIRRARFWMSFSDSYLKHLEVLQNVGMTRIDPVMYEGREVIPLKFLRPPT